MKRRLDLWLTLAIFLWGVVVLTVIVMFWAILEALLNPLFH